MEKKDLKTKVLSGLVWTFAERILAQGVSFIISIIIARLLVPEAYGTVTMVIVFINIANVFVSNGLGEALVQKKDADETDFSTMFYCSMSLAVGIYLILYIGAPYIARFYNTDILIPVLRVLALNLPISAISTIQHAYVSKHMIFKKFFFSTFAGTLISGIVGAMMAYWGFGVWALVAQYLTNTTIDTIVLFVTIPWRPRLKFSKDSALSLGKYGAQLMLTSLIQEVYTQLRSLIIGKVYSASDLAYYNKGNQFPSLIITNVDTSIGKVVFPAMTQSKDDKKRLKAVSRRAMKTTAYIIFPLMAGLFVVARPLILLLLTDKWLECVPFLQIACISFALIPVQTTNWQIIKATGRSDICLKLEILKKIIGITVILGTMNISVLAVAISAAFVSFVSMLINISPNKKLIGYSYGEQAADLLPSFISSIVMAGIIYNLKYFIKSNFFLIFAQFTMGVAIYIIISVVFKLDSFEYLLDTVKKVLKRGSDMQRYRRIDSK